MRYVFLGNRSFQIQYFFEKYSNRLRFIGTYLLIFIALFACYQLYEGYTSFTKPVVPLEFRHLQKLRSHEQKSASECKVPLLDPWDPSIKSYYIPSSPLRCKPIQQAFVKQTNEYLEFDETNVGDNVCSLIPFGHYDGVSDFDVKFDFNSSRRINNQKKVKMENEFVEVSCKSNGLLARDVFKMHYATIIPVTSSNISGSKIEIAPSSDDRPSVVMIGLDSMSRSNFIRQLPLTHKLMQSMGFQDMVGQVKIADNTYGNWIAMLTGKRGGAVKEFEAELDGSWDIAFDDFEFVWNNFSKNGYATLFAEDRPDIGTFNYLGKLKGFLTTPVDHYFRTYWLASFWSLVGRRSTPYCYDERSKHAIQLEYLQQFVDKYSSRRHFAWWWSQDMSHDYLNSIGAIDVDFESFLRRNEKNFENTIVFMFSDHGHRYDKIRETVVGRLEARLPFLSIRLPPKIKQKYPQLVEQLAVNSKKMTTQFDLNAALNDIAFGDWVRTHEKATREPTRRAYSLFGPMPDTRTCHQAHSMGPAFSLLRSNEYWALRNPKKDSLTAELVLIWGQFGIHSKVPEDFCPCFTETEIPLNESHAPAMALLNGINDILSAVPILDEASSKAEDSIKKDYTCLPLTLKEIKFASMRLPPEKVVHDPQTGFEVPSQGLEIKYRVVIEAAAPSGALLEGVVVRRFDPDEWMLGGEIERNNKYGNSSHCVTDPIVRKLCHCMKTP